MLELILFRPLKKDWKRIKKKHPTLAKGAAAGIEMSAGAYLECYGTWMHDFDAPRSPTDPEGPQSLRDFFEENPLESSKETGEVGVPFILKMIGVPRKYWFFASRGISFLGMYLLYRGSKKLGNVIGQANHLNNEARLKENDSDTLFDVYYYNKVEKVLRNYNKYHQFFSKCIGGGLGVYISSQVIIALDWWWKYKYGLGDGIYALIWNDVYHLLALPALIVMAIGGFYKGTIDSEKQYDYKPDIDWDGEKIIKEAILIKALDKFNKLHGRKLEDFVTFLQTDFKQFNSKKTPKEYKWFIKDEDLKSYAIERYLEKRNLNSIMEDTLNRIEDFSLIKYIIKISNFFKKRKKLKNILESDLRYTVKEDCKINDNDVRKYAINNYLDKINQDSVIRDLKDFYKDSIALQEICGRGYLTPSGFYLETRGSELSNIFDRGGLIEYARIRFLHKTQIKEIHDNSISHE